MILIKFRTKITPNNPLCKESLYRGSLLTLNCKNNNSNYITGIKKEPEVNIVLDILLAIITTLLIYRNSLSIILQLKTVRDNNNKKKNHSKKILKEKQKQNHLQINLNNRIILAIMPVIIILSIANSNNIHSSYQ